MVGEGGSGVVHLGARGHRKGLEEEGRRGVEPWGEEGSMGGINTGFRTVEAEVGWIPWALAWER